MSEPTRPRTDPPVHMRRSGFDPAPELAEMREADAIGRVTTVMGVEARLVTRREHVRQVLGDADAFSNEAAFARTPLAGRMTEGQRRQGQVGNLLVLDDPDHHRLRRLLTPEFTVRGMRRLRPRIVEIVDEHLDALERAGSPADLVAGFALPVPSLVICELLGVPFGDRDAFQARTRRQLDVSLPIDERVRQGEESRAYMGGLVDRARAEPGEDLLGMLVREHGDELTRDELTGIASLLLVAGHETTSNMLGLGTLALLRHPAQLARVRDDDAAVVPAVEELLRWLSIVHTGVARTARRDVEVGGETIAAGEVVLCALPAANRDPRATPDPERLDVTRGQVGHVAFGHGAHHCIGAPLARLEMQIAFPALLRRFPALAEAPGATFRSFAVVYGLESLPVTW